VREREREKILGLFNTPTQDFRVVQYYPYIHHLEASSLGFQNPLLVSNLKQRITLC